MTEMTSIIDPINTGLLLVTALGVMAAFWEMRMGARAQRASFLKDLYMQMRTDEDVARAFYLIEYGKFVYDDAFHGSEVEPKIDRLLTVCDLVCEMRLQGVITRREMGFFSYQFDRVAHDKHVQAYLEHLNAVAAENEIDHQPFSAFQTYARQELM